MVATLATVLTGLPSRLPVGLVRADRATLTGVRGLLNSVPDGLVFLAAPPRDGGLNGVVSDDVRFSVDLLTARAATDRDLLFCWEEEVVERMVGLCTLIEGNLPSTALALGGRGGRESNTLR